MPPKPSQFTSIQSFFTTSKPNASASSSDASKEPGDGFTSEEVEAVTNPTIDEDWLPSQEYEEVEIASLIPGPMCVTFRGRIANFYDQVTPNKRPRAAKGCLRVVVKDETGAVTVRLWYANLSYLLQLGQLVTIWTPHISNGEHGNLGSAQAPLFTSIFPERDRSCHFLIQRNSDDGSLCKAPLGFKRRRPLAGLMTLQNFVEGGYDVQDARLLVCVRSIGPKKRIVPKSGKSPPNDLINIHIFDSTYSNASLSLWGTLTLSATSWKPGHTILLLTSPGWQIDRNLRLSLNSGTLADVDPAIPDTLWLRNFAARLTRQEDQNPPFPKKKELDVQAATEAPNQILFTFAELDEFARAAPLDKFVGWVSVVITEVNLTSLHRRNTLMSATHCGIPLHANKSSAVCRACSEGVNLRPNPKILGPVIDETGCTQTGKLSLSDDAWEGLLGKNGKELCETSVDGLRWMEQRMLFARVSMGVAWWAEEKEEDGSVGRVWVWAVRS